MNSEIMIIKQENESNMKRFESNLKFSQEANKNLKVDYDNLQSKFDKHMKATNNLNMDLKEDIEALQAEIGKLRIFKDDVEENLQKLRGELEKEVKDQLESQKEIAKMAN